MIIYIHAEFVWKAQQSFDTALSAPTNIELEITLTKRKLDDPEIWRGEVLEETASQPKIYRLQLEKSSFLVVGRTTYGANPPYEYRLTWDSSPYPPYDQWKMKRWAEAYEFWQMKDFYCGKMSWVRS